MSLPVAVQVFSVRDDAARNLRETLSAIKQMGYDGVEFAGLYGYSPAEIKLCHTTEDSISIEMMAEGTVGTLAVTYALANNEK